MNEKPFQNFDSFEISEDEIEALRNGIKPPDSDVDISEESLNQDIKEVVLEMSEEELEMIEGLKKTLLEKTTSFPVVEKISFFATSLKKKYGKSVYDNAIYCALIGGTIEDSHTVQDFEGQDSIISFVENL